MDEHDQYESIGLDDSLKDGRDLDQIMADRRAAEIELDTREGVASRAKLPHLLNEQDTDDDSYRPSKRTKAPPGPRGGDDNDAMQSSLGRSQRNNLSGEDIPMTDATDDDQYEVQMQGMAVGRAVDLTVLNGYDDLINELEEMFEIKGQIYPRNQWEIVFTDDEGVMMLMGDDPWQEFCGMVKRILVCSSQDVKKMKVGSSKLPVSYTDNEDVCFCE